GRSTSASAPARPPRGAGRTPPPGTGRTARASRTPARSGTGRRWCRRRTARPARAGRAPARSTAARRCRRPSRRGSRPPPPAADPAAVLDVRLDRQVAHARRHDVADLATALVALVAVEDVALGALLVVHHEADDDPRPVRPRHLRRAPPVADEVPLAPILTHLDPPPGCWVLGD